MAYESYPNTPHAGRAVSLVEHELLTTASTRSGLVGPPSIVAGTLPLFGDSSGRQVKVRAGVAANVRGTRFTNGTETIVPITANASGNPRIDLVVLRLNRATYEVTPVAIAGTPAASPAAPSPVRNAPGGNPDYWDIPLGEVTVANGAATITAGNVTNRAWWVTDSGYTGYSTARPPIEPGVIWRENDTGIAWIGTAAGGLEKLYHYATAALADQTGWTTTDMQVTRSGLDVNLSVRILRSGAAIGATTSVVFTNIIPALYRPGALIWDVYHVSDPSRAAVASVDTAGTLQFSRDNTNTINTNAVISCGMSWTLPPGS